MLAMSTASVLGLCAPISVCGQEAGPGLVHATLQDGTTDKDSDTDGLELFDDGELELQMPPSPSDVQPADGNGIELMDLTSQPDANDETQWVPGMTCTPWIKRLVPIGQQAQVIIANALMNARKLSQALLCHP